MEKLCPNCKRGIYMNFDLHVIHCTRKYKLCTVCDEVVAISELDEHLKSHGTVECPVCKKDVERKDMQMHEETACTPRMSVECEFCHLHIPLLEYQKHLHYCGSRTEQCYVCGARVTLNDLEVHLRGHASTREVIGGSSGSRTPTNVPTLASRPESISEFARSAMAAAADADGFGIEFGGAGRNTPSPVPRPWTPQSPLRGEPDFSEVMLVAILDELVENAEEVIRMLETLLEEVDNVRNQARLVGTNAKAVAKHSSVIPQFISVLFGPSASQKTRVLTALVGILAGVVEIGATSYADLKADGFVVKLREIFEEERRKLDELKSFWGVSLDGILPEDVQPKIQDAGGIRGVAKNFLRNFIPILQEGLRKSRFGQKLPPVFDIFQAFLAALTPNRLDDQASKPGQPLVEELLELLRKMLSAGREHRDYLLLLQRTIQEFYPAPGAVGGSPLVGSPTRNEIPGDVYFSPEPGAMGDLADTIPCDICLLNVPFHLYQEHALACQPADDNPYITGMSMGSAMNRSPPPSAFFRPRSPSPAPSPPMDMEPEPGPSGQQRYNEPMPGPSVQQRRKIPYGPLAGPTGFLGFNSPRPLPTGFLGFNSPEPRPPGSSGFINPRPRLSAFVEFNNAQPGPSGLQDFDNPQPGPSGLSTRPRLAPFRSFERTYDSSSDDDVQTIPCDICHRHVEEHVYARHLKECKDRKVRRAQQGHNNDEDVWAMEHGARGQNGRGVDPNTPIPCDACGEIIPLDAYLDHALHAHSNHRMWNPNEAVPFPPDAFPTRDHYRRSSSFDQAERRSSMSPQRRTGTKRDSRSRETSGSGNELVVIDSDEEEQPKKKRSYVPTRNTVAPPRPRATSDTRPTNGLLASLPLPPLNPKPEKPYYEIPEWIIHGAHGTIKRDLLRLSGKLNRETDCPDTGNKNEIAYRTRAFTLISARAQVAARIVALGLRATGDEELRKRLKDDIVAGRSHESAARELCALNRWSEPRYESRLADDGTIVVTAIVNLLPAQGGRRIHPQSAVAGPASVMAGSSRREPAPAEAQAAITAPAQTSAPVSARAAVPHRSTASLPAQAAVAVQAHAAIPVQDFAAIPAPIAAMVQIPSTPGNTNDARPRASSSAAAGTSNGNKKVENKPQQQPRRSIRANIPGRGVSASQTCRRASDRIRDRKQHRADNEAEEQGQADGDRGRGHGRGGQGRGQGQGRGGGRGRGGRGRGAHNGATPKTLQDPRRSL